jgi:hypothetical protein
MAKMLSKYYVTNHGYHFFQSETGGIKALGELLSLSFVQLA